MKYNSENHHRRSIRLKWNDDTLNDKNGDMVMENCAEYNSETWMV
jgi:hypothetical protein